MRILRRTDAALLMAIAALGLVILATLIQGCALVEKTLENKTAAPFQAYTVKQLVDLCEQYTTCERTQAPAPAPTPAPVEDGFTAAPGVSVERRVTLPIELSFEVTGVDRFSGRDDPPDGTNHKDGSMLAWAYGEEWGSGKVPGVVQLRGYKLICNDRGTVREAELFEDAWQADHTYAVYLRLTREAASVEVLDLNTGHTATGSKPCVLPATMSMGLGWPPSRPGILGARFTKVRWSK